MKGLYTLLLLLVSAILQAQTVDINQVKAWIDEGVTEIEQECLFEAVLVSVPDNPNLGMNTQISSETVSNLVTKRYGYFQTKDASSGLLVHFSKTATIRSIPRFATVTLNIQGATLRRTDGGGYGIYNVGENSIVNIVKTERGDFPVKQKKINELSDNDIYTLVRVSELEFVFKDGSYSNVYEAHTQKSKVNASCGPTQKIDNWAGLLCDSDGQSIYYVLSTRAPWRRDGNGVPQGRGILEGILIPNTDMPRYGGQVLGKYQILPMSSAAFMFKENSAWNTLVEWNWNDNVPELRTLQGDRKQVAYEHVLPDVGEGELYSSTGGKIVRFRDMNNVNVISEKGNPNWKGIVANGALSIQCPSSSWWNWRENRGNGLQLYVPVGGIKATQLALAFTFAAGKCNAEGALHFPCKWAVEYSVDGNNYVRLNKEPIILRALPYAPYVLNGEKYQTSSEAAAGYTEHFVNLPLDILKYKNVYIRIVPMAKNSATLAYEGTMNGSLHPKRTNATIVNFGAVKIIYR